MQIGQIKLVQSVNPKRLADEADRGFVDLARFMMRLVTWDRPFWNHEKKVATQGEGMGTTAERESDFEDSSSTGRKHPFDSRFFATMSDRIESIMNRGDGNRSPQESTPESGHGSTVDRSAVASKMRELFHGESAHRLSAVKWIREHRCVESIPTLEGILRIEECPEVNEEIHQTLETFRAIVSKKES